jgi:UDP-3-O-[3-hydroxymyristoyl] N-acetylglucosamine deacetylase
VRKFNHSVVPTCHLLQTAQPQQTISKPVTREGIGLHSGERATLRLLPAGAGEGRYFVQLPKEANKEAVIVPATVKNVIDTRLSTCLGKNRASVYTVEHLMSALEGLGVDNCRIEIDGGSEVIIIITIIMYMHASFRSGNFLIPVAAAMILEVTEHVAE